MDKKFNLIVIGGGSAGYAAARTVHENGGSVAVVDGGEQLSGLCILRGCMPSKTLIYSAEVLHLAKQGDVFGFEKTEIKADLPAIQKEEKRNYFGICRLSKKSIRGRSIFSFSFAGKICRSKFCRIG